MQTFGNKTYLSRSESKRWSIEFPVGDPHGGAAYGEKNDPGSLISGGLGLAGSILGGNSAQDAAQTQANAQLQASRDAAQQAQFRPVGMTTSFGNSQFKMGPDGRLQSAGYSLNPQMQGMQNQFMGQAQSGLNQYLNGQQSAQPLYQGAQSAMNLGQGYLQQNPQAQAAQYMAQQEALLAPQRAQQDAQMNTNMFNTGRMGLGVGATSANAGGMGNSNPELQAMLNARAMQDTQLAANATQGGQQNAAFGAQMLNQGAGGLNNYYSAQTNALNPYNASMGAAQNIDQLGQQALNLGAGLGNGSSYAAMVQNQGGQNAANSMFNANSYNPAANVLSGMGNMMQNYKPDSPPPTTQQQIAMMTMPNGGYPMSNSGQPQYSSLTNQLISNPYSMWNS